MQKLSAIRQLILLGKVSRAKSGLFNLKLILLERALFSYFTKYPLRVVPLPQYQGLLIWSFPSYGSVCADDSSNLRT